MREENLDLSSHNDNLSEQVERLKKIEDKLRKELDLSKGNEEGLMRELEEIKESMTRMASSTQNLDHILSVGKNPHDKRGLGFEEGKKSSTLKKTIFVKSSGNKETSLVQIPRKKLELGQCSNAQVKVVLRGQPQARPSKVLQANIPQQLAHKGKRPIIL